MGRLAVARAEQVPAVAQALAAMHKGKVTSVCSRSTAPILKCGAILMLSWISSTMASAMGALRPLRGRSRPTTP